jgi:hypothetical protein
MSEQIYISIIEIFIGIVIEGILLSMIFAFISNQTSEKQSRNLEAEMGKIEMQNKFIYDQIMNKLEKAKTEIISQIKEADYHQKGGNK